MVSTRTTLGLSLVLLGLQPAQVHAQDHRQPTLTIHLADHQQVDGRELAEAQALVSGIYEGIGVRVVWTDGGAKLAPADGTLHVDVIVLNAELTDRTDPAPGIVGQAGHTTLRAYIFYPRVIAEARQQETDSARALAYVMAHELGHILLPEYSHTPAGIMRQRWEGRITHMPDFLHAQAVAIRVTVVAAN
jgi:hypothetical protein